MGIPVRRPRADGPTKSASGVTITGSDCGRPSVRNAFGQAPSDSALAIGTTWAFATQLSELADAMIRSTVSCSGFDEKPLADVAVTPLERLVQTHHIDVPGRAVAVSDADPAVRGRLVPPGREKMESGEGMVHIVAASATGED